MWTSRFNNLGNKVLEHPRQLFALRKSSPRQENTLERLKNFIRLNKSILKLYPKTISKKKFRTSKKELTGSHSWIWFKLKAEIWEIRTALHLVKDLQKWKNEEREEYDSSFQMTRSSLSNEEPSIDVCKSDFFTDYVTCQTITIVQDDVTIRFKESTDKVDVGASFCKIRPFFLSDKGKKTVRSSSTIFDIQTTNCVEFSKTSTSLHQGTWHLYWNSLGDRIPISTIIGKTMQWTWLVTFLLVWKDCSRTRDKTIITYCIGNFNFVVLLIKHKSWSFHESFDW